MSTFKNKLKNEIMRPVQTDRSSTFIATIKQSGSDNSKSKYKHNIEFIDDPLAIFCRNFLPSSASLSSASVFSSGSSSIVLLFGMIGSVFTWSNRRFDVSDDDFDLLIYDNSLFALKKNVKLIIIINLIFLYLQSYSFAGAEPRQSTWCRLNNIPIRNNN